MEKQTEIPWDNTVIADINCVGKWLACDETLPAHTDASAIVLAGNAVIPTIDHAFQLAVRHRLPVVITGGIGHSTIWLYRAVAAHPRYHVVACEGRSEAAILADIGRQFWQIPDDRLLLETASTHCGENVDFSWDTLCRHGITPTSLIVVQDPTMQRRTLATFARLRASNPAVPPCLSSPGYIPALQKSADGADFVAAPGAGWSLDRFAALVLGEIPRLYDSPQGYGPAGRGFIVHVDIPDRVMDAWRRLTRSPAVQQRLAQRIPGQTV